MNKAIQTVEPAPLPVEAQAPTSILAVIARAAADPSIDVEKMQRLMEMHERVLARQAAAAFNASLADMQPELPIVTQRGEISHNGKLISKFARWEDIVEQIRPVLAKHGFSLTFTVGQAQDRMSVTGVLRHREGHNEQTTLSLPIDMSGAKNAVQGIGSTVSYGKRYVACALLNIASTGEDQDGVDQNGTITAEQKETLIALMRETGADTAKFLKFIGAESVDAIKARDFDRAKHALETKRAKANADS